MQLPRYTKASRVVPEIQGELQSSISPALAASTEQAKWGVASDAFTAAAEVTQFVANAKAETEKANDKIQNTIDDNNYNYMVKRTNEEHKTRAEELDPSWTPKLLVDDITKLNELRMESAQKLTNPMIRNQTIKLIEGQQELMVKDAGLNAIEFNAARAYNSFEQTYNTAIEEEDYDFAKNLLETAMDTSDGTPIIDVPKGQAAMSKLNNLIKTKDQMEFVDDWQSRYMQNPEEGMKEYTKILNDPKLSAEDAKTMESLMQGAMNRANVALNHEEAEINEEYNTKMNQALLAQEAGKPIYTSVQEIMDADLGPGSKGLSRKLTLARSLTQGVAKQNKLDIFADQVANVKNGVFLKGTTGQREQMDELLASRVTEDMSSEDYLKMKRDLRNEAQIPFQSDLNTLNAGTNSAANMKRAYPLWKELNSGPVDFDLELDDPVEFQYEYLDMMTEYAETPEDINSAYEQLEQRKENTLKSGNYAWTNKVFDGETRTGQDKLQESWEEISEDGDFRKGFLSPDDTDRNKLANLELYLRFMKYGEEAMALGATPEQAKHLSRKLIEKAGGSTDINGRYENQLNLPRNTEKVKMEHLKDEAIGTKGGFTGLYSGVVPVVETMEDGSTSMSNQKVQYYTTAKDEPFKTDKLDKGKVKLYVPLQKDKSRTPDGDVVFEVYYDGNPLIAITEKGQTPVKVAFSKSEFQEQQEDTTDYAQQIRDEQKALEKLQKEQERRKGHPSISGLNVYGTRNLDTKIKQKENLIKQQTKTLKQKEMFK